MWSVILLLTSSPLLFDSDSKLIHFKSSQLRNRFHFRQVSVLFQRWWQQFRFWQLPEPFPRLWSQQQGAHVVFYEFITLTPCFQSDSCYEANTASAKKKPLSKISKFPGRSRSGSADVTITGNFSENSDVVITASWWLFFILSDFERKCTQIAWNPAHQEIAVACQNNILVYTGTPA